MKSLSGETEPSQGIQHTLASSIFGCVSCAALAVDESLLLQNSSAGFHQVPSLQDRNFR